MLRPFFLDGLHDSALPMTSQSCICLEAPPAGDRLFLQLFLLDGAPDEQIQLIVVERF